MADREVQVDALDLMYMGHEGGKSFMDRIEVIDSTQIDSDVQITNIATSQDEFGVDLKGFSAIVASAGNHLSNELVLD